MNNHKLTEMGDYLGQPRPNKPETLKKGPQLQLLFSLRILDGSGSRAHVEENSNKDTNKGSTAEKPSKGAQTKETSISTPQSTVDKTEPNSKAVSTEIDERRTEFLNKYKEFKIIRHQAAERKRKWLKWQKTEWKYPPLPRQSDFFTDSSDEEALDQVSLTDEASLQFLENHINILMKKKEIDKQKAIERKNAGNNFISKKDYGNAVKCYSEGIEYMKDMKELYTNRALAYLKLNEYPRAIQDCTRILEFIECFEGNFVQSSSICVKVIQIERNQKLHYHWNRLF